MQKHRRSLIFFAAIISLSFLLFPHIVLAQSVDDLGFEETTHRPVTTDSQHTIISPLPDSQNETKPAPSTIGTNVSPIISPLASDEWTEEILTQLPKPDHPSMNVWQRFTYGIKHLYYKIFPSARPLSQRLIFHHASPKPDSKSVKSLPLPELSSEIFLENA